MELEAAADPSERGAYPLAVVDGEIVRLDPRETVRAIVEDLAAGVSPALVSARFHNALADATVERSTLLARARAAWTTAVLAGGVFQNRLLLERCTAAAARERSARPASRARCRRTTARSPTVRRRWPRRRLSPPAATPRRARRGRSLTSGARARRPRRSGRPRRRRRRPRRGSRPSARAELDRLAERRPRESRRSRPARAGIGAAEASKRWIVPGRRARADRVDEHERTAPSQRRAGRASRPRARSTAICRPRARAR